jgi:membrane-bound serine protease (ClpP class)
MATVTLFTKNAKVKEIVAGWRFKVLDVVANPNIAYILMMIGGIGIMVELYNPGLIFPGVLGALCLLLAFFALQVLPVNYVGILLIIMAVVLFILEVKIPSFGLLSIAAIISLTLGSVMLFETGEMALRVSWSVIIPTVAMVSAFFVFAMGLAARAWMTVPRTGEQGLAGEMGLAITDIDTEGKVLIRGEYWNAVADEPIGKGQKVRVVGARNLIVRVTQA